MAVGDDDLGGIDHRFLGESQRGGERGGEQKEIFHRCKFKGEWGMVSCEL